MENKRVVHHLQAASITIGNQRGGGRHPTFTPEQKAEFQGKLEEALLSLQVKRKPNLAIAYVRTIIGGIEATDDAILKHIVRPVFRKLKTKK
jgi:hypothetical protein